MTSTGIKAQLKQELKAAGIRTIKLQNGHTVRLANAKTSELIRLQEQLQTQKG